MIKFWLASLTVTSLIFCIGLEADGAKSIYDNSPRQLVKIIGTYPQNMNFTDVPINPPLNDASKTIIFTTFSHTSSNDNSDTSRAWEILNNSAVRIYGETNSMGNNALDFEMNILEFDIVSQLETQKSEFVLEANAPEGEFDVTMNEISNVTQAQLTYQGFFSQASESTYGKEEFVKVNIVDRDKWKIKLAQNPNTGNNTIKVKITDWKDKNINTQRANATMSPTAQQLTIIPPLPVDPTRSLLMISHFATNNTVFSSPPDESMISATFDVNDNIVVSREATTPIGMTIFIEWEIVQYPPNFFSIQHGEFTQVNGISDSTITVPPVSDASKAFVIGTVQSPFGQSGGRNDSNEIGAFDRSMWTLNMDNESILRATRGDGNGTGTIGYQIVEIVPDFTYDINDNVYE